MSPTLFAICDGVDAFADELDSRCQWNSFWSRSGSFLLSSSRSLLGFVTSSGGLDFFSDTTDSRCQWSCISDCSVASSLSFL